MARTPLAGSANNVTFLSNSINGARISSALADSPMPSATMSSGCGIPPYSLLFEFDGAVDNGSGVMGKKAVQALSINPSSLPTNGATPSYSLWAPSTCCNQLVPLNPTNSSSAIGKLSSVSVACRRSRDGSVSSVPGGRRTESVRRQGKRGRKCCVVKSDKSSDSGPSSNAAVVSPVAGGKATGDEV